MSYVFRYIIGLFFAIVVTVSLTSCLNLKEYDQKGPALQQGSPVEGSLNNAINLNQSWTEDTQQSFYFGDQGSRIMPYKWFLVLEQEDNTELFRSDSNIDAYRYLPSSANSWNPDGLPVGFTKNIDTSSQQQWMGISCAACHTTQIDYKGLSMRIEGGPTLADFESFNYDLVDALTATYHNQDKFDRFAEGVLGADHSANQKSDLRLALLQRTEVLTQRNLVNRPTEDQPNYGYARLDAVGAIFNQILTVFNNDPSNGMAANAPVSYPFLWGTHQSDVVQWPGFAPNGPASAGALIRNGGEVLGVYGQLKIPSDATKKHYSSSINIINLGKLEQWVAELRSPAWPAEYLPPIDPMLSNKGKSHYEKFCMECHEIIAREDEGKPYKAVLTPLAKIGTDPTELNNMVTPRPAGIFAGRKEFVLAGPVIGETTTGLNPLVNSVTGGLLQHPIETIKAGVIEYEGGVIAEQANDGINTEFVAPSASPDVPNELTEALKAFEKLNKRSSNAGNVQTEGFLSGDSSAPDPMVYKARPLNGIWATAPYLHNGSVPNLYELLLPAAQRSESFFSGTREFDPVNVGFDLQIAEQYPKAFKLDTKLLGNSNLGHEFGTLELSDGQRNELLEYLKTL